MATIGDLVLRPDAGTGCQQLPVARESKGSILAAGARVLLTGDCGPGGWAGRGFERGAAWDESGSTTGYACGTDRAGADEVWLAYRQDASGRWVVG